MPTPRRSPSKRPTGKPAAKQRATATPKTITKAKPRTVQEIAAEIEKNQPKLPKTEQGIVSYMETLGKAAGAYYRSLKENAIPADSALYLVESWHELVTGTASEIALDDAD